MDTEFLKEFIDLSETLNYQQTAFNLNLAISSISKHINKLESDVGAKLSNRTSRSVKLSPAGVIFKEYANKIIDLEIQGKEAAINLATAAKNKLKISYMPIMLQYRIPDLVADFHLNHPDADIEMSECSNLNKTYKDVDFVFSEHIIEDDDINAITFAEDYLVVLLPNDHPLSEYTSISAKQLEGENFISHGTSRENLFRASISFNKIANAAGYNPYVALASSSIETVIRLVKNGLGVAVLNRQPGTDMSSMGIKVIDLYPKQIFRIYLLYSKTKKLSPLGQSFVKFIREKALSQFPTPSDLEMALALDRSN